MRHQLPMYGALRAWIASIPRPRVHADVEELINEGGFSSRGPLDASSVETRSVEVREETFFVLGSESAWAGLEGSEAMQAVRTWIREQEEPVPEGRHHSQDSLGFNFPWEYEEDDFGLGWVRRRDNFCNYKEFRRYLLKTPVICVLHDIKRRAARLAKTIVRVSILCAACALFQVQGR